MQSARVAALPFEKLPPSPRQAHLSLHSAHSDHLFDQPTHRKNGRHHACCCHSQRLRLQGPRRASRCRGCPRRQPVSILVARVGEVRETETAQRGVRGPIRLGQMREKERKQRSGQENLPPRSSRSALFLAASRGRSAACFANGAPRSMRLDPSLIHRVELVARGGLNEPCEGVDARSWPPWRRTSDAAVALCALRCDAAAAATAMDLSSLGLLASCPRPTQTLNNTPPPRCSPHNNNAQPQRRRRQGRRPPGRQPGARLQGHRR